MDGVRVGVEGMGAKAKAKECGWWNRWRNTASCRVKYRRCQCDVPIGVGMVVVAGSRACKQMAVEHGTGCQPVRGAIALKLV